MFEKITTKVICPYCGKENQCDFRPYFGRIVKVVKCSCGRYYVADFEISLSNTVRKIDGL